LKQLVGDVAANVAKRPSDDVNNHQYCWVFLVEESDFAFSYLLTPGSLIQVPAPAPAGRTR
jgi:hypothetical protein